MKLFPMSILTTLLVTAATSSAATLEVPNQYPSIQAAINAANPYDVIEIAGGVYYEDLVINNKSHLSIRPQGSGQVIVDAAGAGEPLNISGGAISGIHVKKITFRNTGDSHGIYIGNADDVRIDKCTISAVNLDGIYVAFCSSTVIKKCKIITPSRHGIYSRYGEVLAFKNTITAPGLHGMILAGGLNTARANTITSAGDSGIVVGDGVVYMDTNLVEDNTITLAAVDGILVRGRATSCRILNNVIGKCQDDGIDLIADAGSHTVYDNRIKHAGDSGIQIESNGNVFRRNNIKKAVVDGIYIASFSDGNLFEQNKVKKSLADGIDVMGDNNTFNDNVATGAALYDLRDSGTPFSNSYFGNTFGTVAP